MNDSQLPEQLQGFNLKTMSGVFPGARTQQFYLLQMRLGSAAQLTAQAPAQERANILWVKSFWSEKPPAVQIIDQDGRVLAKFENPKAEKIFNDIVQAMDSHNYQILSCGSCQSWQEVADDANVQCASGICTKQVDEELQSESGLDESVESSALADELNVQSAMALSCPHWQLRAAISTADAYVPQQPNLNAATPPDDFGSVLTTDVDLVDAEASPDAAGHSSWMGKLRHWFGGSHQPQRDRGDRLGHGESTLPLLNQLDRSGVGAGTEPCLGCHGRIANLGALVVETDDGDKQTYSIWRCRNCAATYLNSWIDRWERLDSLETEETRYRIAPAEALRLLGRIHAIDGGDHPKERASREAERAWLEAFLQGRRPLSHQVRHGR